MDFTKRVPDTYFNVIKNGGRIETISYPSVNYQKDLEPVTKSALVYLPNEYDAFPDKEYKVLYLMHGGGGSEREFIHGQDEHFDLLHIIDNMMAEGDVEPMIIVTPSFYYTAFQSSEHSIQEAGELTSVFHQEFRNALVPYIDSHFRTVADRSHRAFGGFSMGGVTTWRILENCLDLVEHFMPLSGDSWIIEEKGGSTFPEKTSEMLKKAIEKNGNSSLRYNIFAATGNQDIAFPALDAQIKTMFADNWNTDPSSLRYFTWEEGTHCYQYINQYIYNILPVLFI